MTAYYNENDAYCAEWLRNLIAAGHIPAGDVDERSISDVRPDDLVGYRQCHFFAGIGGWALASRLAGWPDELEIWTGSPPCQPFSVAGRQGGSSDDRHLWPDFFRLIRARRPARIFGEQVAAAVGKDWLDGVLADLEGIGYAGRAFVIPACAVNAPHRRDRLWLVAESSEGAVDNAERARLEGQRGHDDAAEGWAKPGRSVAEAGGCGNVADAECGWIRGARLGAPYEASGGMQAPDGQRQRLRPDAGADGMPGSGSMADADGCRREARNRDDSAAGYGYTAASTRHADHWGKCEWITGHDGKARRVEPGIPLLAHGVPARVGKLRAYGNAIAPPEAAEIMTAYLDVAA